ncbi:MAG: hypothetical protein AAFU85_04305 [Planctomycetota bacterium]
MSQSLRAAFLCVGFLLVDAGNTHADEAKVDAVVLFNSTGEFGQRTGSDTKTTSAYIKTIERETLDALRDSEATDHQSGVVAVAIRPNGTMKLWIDLDREFENELTNEVQKRMAAKGVPQVVGGPVAFALLLRFASSESEDQPPAAKAGAAVPQDWRRILDRKKGEQLKIPDDLLPLVWPTNEIPPTKEMEEAKAIAENAETFVPDGFVLQSLNPLGGSIPRPTDWHYAEAHRKRQLTWTLSKEPSQSGYVTGVKIQLFIGVQELTKQTPQAFLEKFLESKAKTAKVISRRDPIKQGKFTRVGLETEEPQSDKSKPPFRILYSCFWSNDMDMGAITISGTTTDLWDEYEKTFNVMSKMTIVDLEKAKRDRAKAPAAE